MTGISEKTVGKWLPFAPIALGVLLTAWAVLADHGSIASYNDAWTPGSGPTLTTEFTALDDMPVQVSNLRK